MARSVFIPAMASTTCEGQRFFHSGHFLLHVLFLLSFNFSSNCVVARCIQEHHDSLLLLKSSFKYVTAVSDDTFPPTAVNFSLTFPNDSVLASWRPRTDCCEWKGVICNETESPTGHVTTLDLHNSSLSGDVLHPVVFNLTSLRSLDLSKNFFPDVLFPSDISRLTNLSYLNLDSCMFVGHISDVISPRFRQLTHLNLEFNNFTGSLPESLGELVRLNFLAAQYNFISGSIPTSIKNLTQLQMLELTGNRLNGSLPMFKPTTPIQYISLGDNMLTGPIPFLYTKLPNLTFLVLNRNSLTGFISTSLFTHPALIFIDLDNNNFSGFQGKLSNISTILQYISLRGAGLQDSFPEVFYQSSQLDIFYLNDNNLTGSVDLCNFKNLVNLFALDLSGNRLTVYSSGCDFFLPKFTYLGLRSCNLKEFPEFLWKQNQLMDLDLSGNQIQGLIPKWLWKLEWNDSNSNLNLSQNSLVGVEERIPSDIHISSFIDLHSNRLRSLEPLSPSKFASNKREFVSSIPSNIGVIIKHTTYFSLAKNDLTGEIPASFCEATDLIYLDLSHNKLTGPLPSCLANMTNLLALKVQGNSLSGTIPQQFNRGCMLKVINLNGNMFQDGVPHTLWNCQMLQMLDLGNNHIADVFPFWIGNLSNLKVLILRNNTFSGMLPETWNGSFSKLQVLDLSLNKFIGPLPNEMFGNLRAMQIEYKSNFSSGLLIDSAYTTFDGNSITLTNKGIEIEFTRMLIIYNALDLSRNSFEGQIPDSVGELIALKVLNMSNNHLVGNIPGSLGRVMQLESMDLSRNNISGKIPLELVALTFLEVLNLSYNHLEGHIPQGSQFNTFPINSYIGNKDLCGPPMLDNCNKEVHDTHFLYHKGLSWPLISAEIGFIVGLTLWFMFLFLSTKLSTLLYVVSYVIHEMIFGLFTQKM